MFQPEKDFEEYGRFVFKYLMSLLRRWGFGGRTDPGNLLSGDPFFGEIRWKLQGFHMALPDRKAYLVSGIGQAQAKKRKPLQENGARDGLESAYCRKEQTMEVMKAVHILEENAKEVFLLRITGGFSFKEIGEICGRNENWARVTFYRAKQKIMEEVGRDEM